VRDPAEDRFEPDCGKEDLERQNGKHMPRHALPEAPHDEVVSDRVDGQNRCGKAAAADQEHSSHEGDREERESYPPKKNLNI
jgi:hypothetical protein